MWTHTITAKTKANSDLAVEVEFTDGKDTLRRSFMVYSAEQLRQNIVGTLDTLARRDALAESLSLGEMDLTPPEVSQEEAAAKEFEARKLALVRAWQDLELKLISQAEYDAMLADVKGA